MRYTIENDKIKCEIDTHGAELKSLVRKSDGREMMWGADPAYWNRTSPVLFPFVGAVKDKTYTHAGKEYTIGQHGFARDMEFELVSQESAEIWFALTENEESLSKYPFRFRLEIGYRLEESSVTVMWKVTNPGEEEMYFSIGAHPGFAVDTLAGNTFALYDRNGKPVDHICNRVFGLGGCVTDRETEIAIPDGRLSVTETLFDGDALVLENDQLGRVDLNDSNGKLLVSVSFDAPLAGLWSPPHKNAPFVCIEPWYGRCDSESFTGELKDRDYEQHLAPSGVFCADYTITVG
jgi:galactose mutarotase-like enzyme